MARPITFDVAAMSPWMGSVSFANVKRGGPTWSTASEMDKDPGRTRVRIPA